MLPRVNRLKKKKDFERVFKEGKRYVLPFGKLYLKIIKNNQKNSRFGFVVSKKFSKKATIRNRIKRKLREVIRTKLPEIKKGTDGIVVVGQDLDTEDFRELEEEINKLFKKAGIIKNSKQ
jgi:ribonuclease P protein component